MKRSARTPGPGIKIRTPSVRFEGDFVKGYDSDVLVVGAGIVGLAIAWRITERYPDLKLLVLDKEDEVARHQTSHNSGVIHAGLYYPPGSLKARLAGEGREAMHRFAEERGIPHEISGKIVVALEEAEIPALRAIHARALENAVPGVRLIGPEEIREIEPHARGIMALHSPRTGIIDYAAVARALAEDIRSRGGEIILGAHVTALPPDAEGARVETSRGDFRTRFLITATGLQADRLAGRGPGEADVRVVPFRGSYHLIRPDRSFLVRSLIYPVPDPRLPFLGVHFTKRVTDGAVMVGPNAIFAFAREVYERGGFDAKDAVSLFTWPGTWGVVRRFWRNGLWQIHHDVSLTASLADARRYLPELERKDLIPGPTGIRAQTVTRDGSLTDDFLFAERSHALHIKNAPSPAATASLAIGEYIVNYLRTELEALRPFRTGISS